MDVAPQPPLSLFSRQKISLNKSISDTRSSFLEGVGVEFRIRLPEAPANSVEKEERRRSSITTCGPQANSLVDFPRCGHE